MQQPLVVCTALAVLALVSCVGTLARFNGTIRTYFIAAEEVEWDFAPSNMDLFHGVPLSENPDAVVFCERGDDRIGKVYKKAIYVQYTDATFTARVQQPSWLGFVGPIIRASVGDTIEVVFMNKASRPYSVHPHGVFYDKNSEGALYADNTTNKQGASIEPNQTYKYTWPVPPRAGPASNDATSIMWSYHSHVSEAKDTYSGLIGAMIIYAEGVLQENGLPKGIDREYVIMLQVQDENLSWYIEENIQTYCYKPETVDPGDDGFIESNLMHSINGYVYGNLNSIFMCEGETIRWYVMAFGTEVDLHTAHWHGQTLTEWGHRLDVIELLPASMHTMDMLADNPGNWVMHCHVNDHMTAGMNSYFQVAPSAECSKGYQPWKATMSHDH